MALRKTYAEITDEETVADLRKGGGDWYTVEVRPPRDRSVPVVLDRFVKGIFEVQSSWLGLLNRSPVTVYEIRRPEKGGIRFQYSVPTKRMERKVRTQLGVDIPEASYGPGVDGVAVEEGDSVGGGLLTLGRSDYFPLRTKFQDPPVNSLVSLLHRHAMQDTGIIIQILFQPVAGRPVKRWWWRRRAYKYSRYLKKEKSSAFSELEATSREKKQAKLIERKIGLPRFHVSVRFLFTGAGRHSRSRVKELAGGFNIYESEETDQYFNAVTVKEFRESQIVDFAKAVANRDFDSWTLKFQLSVEELAALVSLPDRKQSNISYSKP